MNSAEDLIRALVVHWTPLDRSQLRQDGHAGRFALRPLLVLSMNLTTVAFVAYNLEPVDEEARKMLNAIKVEINEARAELQALRRFTALSSDTCRCYDSILEHYDTIIRWVRCFVDVYSPDSLCQLGLVPELGSAT